MDAWRDYNWIRAGISNAALFYLVTLILGLNGPILIAPFTYKTSSAVLPLLLTMVVQVLQTFVLMSNLVS